MRISFVCLGNICRSPTAEAVMRHLVAEAGLTDAITVESAGTGSWHVGHPPDARSCEEATRRGIEMAGTARQFDASDFARLDLILAMDQQNAAELVARAPDAGARAKVRLLREFDPALRPGADHAVPDPYYGGPEGFTDVFDMVERACRGLLDEYRAGRLAGA
ncbi:MAG: low molecular weight protein-tyrosine-phosphatase [Miltoncostaeaceae bacterium]